MDTRFGTATEPRPPALKLSSKIRRFGKMAAATLHSSSVDATSMSFNVRSIAVIGSGSPSSSSSGNSYSSRLGRLTFSRGETAPHIELATPTLWTHTSRGVVSHLTRDQVFESDAIRGVHIPFES